MGGPGMLSCALSPRSLVLPGCGVPSGGHLPMCWQLLTLARWEEENRGQSCSLERSLTGRGAGRGGWEGQSEPASVSLCRHRGAQEEPCHFSSRSCHLSPGAGLVSSPHLPAAAFSRLTHRAVSSPEFTAGINPSKSQTVGR